MIGLIKAEGQDEHQKKYLAEKRAQHEARNQALSGAKDDAGSFPTDAQLCAKCSTKAVIKMDGCMTCLNCGDSKCG
jgi:hypothetical protein